MAISVCYFQELLVAAGDMGRDYEHCLELQKKVNDVEGVWTVKWIIMHFFLKSIDGYLCR